MQRSGYLCFTEVLVVPQDENVALARWQPINEVQHLYRWRADLRSLDDVSGELFPSSLRAPVSMTQVDERYT